jgi:hypothetical protein
MTEYARPLWLGGGISYEALERLEEVILRESTQPDVVKNPHLRTELMNVANAARAEIQRRPQPKCDLI